MPHLSSREELYYAQKRAEMDGLELIGGLSLLALAMVGCSRVRDNAHVTSEVQNRIRNDYRLQMARIQVRSTNGIVTLSGYVSTDEQRAATVQDAARIKVSGL